MNNKSQARQKIRYRIRKKVNGTASTPRLTVFRSNADIYAQLIDDATGTTLAGSSSINCAYISVLLLKTVRRGVDAVPFTFLRMR